MMLFNKTIPRRSFIRGVSAAVALPLLDAMTPVFASNHDSVDLYPQRFSTAYVPNGIIMDKWTPSIDGAAFEMTPTLQPLSPFKQKMLVLTGLAHKNARALVADEAGGFHPRASSVFLTGSHPKRTEGADFRVGISVDQVIAKEAGRKRNSAL